YTEELFATSTGLKNSAKLDFYKKEYEKSLRQVQQDKQINHAELDSTSEKKTKIVQNNKTKALAEKKFKNELAILSRNLKTDLQKSLTERYTAWQLEEIDKKRQKYLEKLYKKLEQFKKLEELLSPFIKNFGRLWDLSTGCFNDYGFEILKDFADLLENDEALIELADLIGRQENEKEHYEIELRNKVEIKTEYHPKNAYRGQISGLRLSGEITAALPSELALFQNAATKVYFSQKFAEKKLLSYAYINLQKYFREEHKKEQVKKAVKGTDQKGPVIICVDTSGSMNGTPERVAKTITFALAKKCLNEERKCFLISFSSGIEVQDLSDFSKANGIEELVNFLRKSFNGGTDAEPALLKSLELMQTNEWKNADVLVVSDMIMGEFSEKLTTDIETQREKKSKFYSLVVGNSGNQKVIECFNENWTYDSNARDAMHHLVRQIHKIG
nr:VWA domain-containing protein [Treponema sp.]